MLSNLRVHRVPALLTLIGAVLSVWAFLNAEHREREQFARAFEKTASDYTKAIGNAAKETHYILEALHSFHKASEYVTRPEFSTYSKHLLTKNPAVKALEWAPRVKAEERARFEMQAQEEGLANFRVMEVNTSGNLVPAGNRKQYFPVSYAEPIQGNEKALGYDLSSDPVCSEALWKAVDTAEPQATGRIRLVQEEETFYSYLIFQPVFRAEDAPKTSRERREALQGFYVGVYRMADLFRPKLLELEPADLWVDIYDMSASEAERLLVSYSFRDGTFLSGAEQSKARGNRTLHFEESFFVAGRNWVVRCTPSANWLTPEGTRLSWLALFGGLSATLLLSSYVFLILGRARTARSHSVEMARAKEILETEIKGRAMVESSLAERVRLAELDSEVGRILATEENYDEILQHCCEVLVQRLDAALARIWVIDAPGNTLHLKASAGMYRHLDGAHSRIPLGQYKIGLIAEQRLPILTNTVLGDNRIHDQDWVKREGITAFAGHPIVLEERLYGVIALFSKKQLTVVTNRALAATATLIAIGAERRRAQDLLHQERDRAQNYLDVAGVILLALDRDGNIQLINRKGAELLGEQEDEIPGLNWFDRFIPEHEREKVRSVFQRLMAGEFKPQEYFENTILTSGGEERMISWHNALLRNDKGEISGTLSSGEDITERTRMEAELSKREKLASLGVLAGGIAHDFNNLLTAVVGNITLAKLQKDNPVRISELLTQAEEAIFRAENLTRQLLTFSKGGTPIVKAISLEALVRESVDFLLHGSKVKCNYDFADDLWTVLADPGQVNQVLNNLVINADQAMPNGGTIEVTCKNTQIQEKDALPINEGDYVQVSIRDRGSGIPPAHLERIFEPYFSTKKHGSGLGLAVVYSIIQRHGGHIYVTSSPGSGSTFTFYLPASSTPLENQTSRIEAAPSGSGNILIMDDEPAVRQVAGNLLQYQGYNVAFAEDGAQAIEKYREAMGSPAPFDVVVMDLTVPGGMGGVDAIGQLLTLDSGAKVIVSSGYSQDPVMANFRKYGFCGVLVKPYRASSLSRLLQEILGSSPDSGSAE